MAYIIRSVDLGYGNTKLTCCENSGGCVFDCFESAAVVGDLDTNGHNYNIVRVPVGSKNYLVGHDVYLVSNSYNVRPLHDDYIATDEYAALMKAALKSMDVQTIDLLVIGLPVRLYRSRYHSLKTMWKGSSDLGDGQSVNIRNVIVTIQPMGAYRDYQESAKNQRTDHFTGRTLVIDPGWQTLDWLLVEGGNPIVDSTDSNNYGISGMLNKVSRSISDASSSELPLPTSALLTEVDSWIRAGEINLYGGKIKTPIAPYLKSGLDYINKAVESMYGALTQRHAIQEVVLAGGAAQLYLPAVQRAFPHHNIIVPDDPVYANVRGFHLLGMDAVRKYTTQSTGKE